MSPEVNLTVFTSGESTYMKHSFDTLYSIHPC